MSVTGNSDLGLEPNFLAQYWLEREAVLNTVCVGAMYVFGICKHSGKKNNSIFQANIKDINFRPYMHYLYHLSVQGRGG